MESHIVKILAKVPRSTQRPSIYRGKARRIYRCTGQATEVSISKPGWEEERRPLTLPASPNGITLEFTIKIYDEHNSVARELGQLKAGDQLILHDDGGIPFIIKEKAPLSPAAQALPFHRHPARPAAQRPAGRQPADLL